MATQVTTAEATIRTNHEPSSTAWFWWKESRQLAPLLVMLVAVAFLALFFDLIGSSLWNFQVPHEALLLAIPGLFATGAGPLLVGQERSTRTIEWLTLLPVSPSRLAITKLLVSLVGLVVIWMFSLLLLAVTGDGSSKWSTLNPNDLLYDQQSILVWLIHSLFVLLVGFYVSWRIENQFYALLLLIGIAFSPFIAVSVTSGLLSRALLAKESGILSLIFTAIGVAVMFPLSLRAAARTLGAKPAPSLNGFEVSRSSVAAATVPEFNTQTAPVIWQSFHSAKGTWMVISVMLLVGCLGTMSTPEFGVDILSNNWLPLFVLLFAVATSWIGVCVFKHDGAAERLRFLADRGVSWKRTYLALHGFPIAMVSTLLLLFALFNLKIDHFNYDAASGMPSLLTMMFFVVTAYSVSQWASQIFRTLILSVIIAPILAWTTVGWLSSAIAMCGVPVWCVVVCALTPMLASFVMMKHYMDGRDRPWTFAVGAAAVAIIIGLPIFTMYRRIQAIPGMTPSQRTALLNEARKARSQNLRSVFVALSYSGRYSDQTMLLNAEQLIDSAKSYRYEPQVIVAPLTTQSGEPVRPAYCDSAFQFWYENFSLSQLTWESNPETWPDYAVFLDSSVTLLRSLRADHHYWSQEYADRLEIMLLDALSQEAIRAKRDSETVQKVVRSIGTPQSRAKARREAVLAQWAEAVMDPDDPSAFNFYGYFPENASGLAAWAEPRVDEAIVLALLDGIEAAKTHSASTGWLHDLHELITPTIPFEESQYGPAWRKQPVLQILTYQSRFAPGMFMGRDWEYVDPNALLVNESTVSPNADEQE